MLRGCHATPLWQLAILDLLDKEGVCVDSFLFEVADCAVDEPWAYQVEEKNVHESSHLRYTNEGSEQYSWLSHCQEKEQMHAFSLCLLQEMMDPATVFF